MLYDSLLHVEQVANIGTWLICFKILILYLSDFFIPYSAYRVKILTFLVFWSVVQNVVLVLACWKPKKDNYRCIALNPAASLKLLY